MKNGFKGTLDYILRSYGMMTAGVRGATVYANKTNRILRELGYDVDKSIGDNLYGFVYLSQGATDMPTVVKALHNIDVGCIILFRPCCPEVYDILRTLGPISKYLYNNNSKEIGVLVKTHEFKP